jgi:hypothetical protein
VILSPIPTPWLVAAVASHWVTSSMPARCFVIRLDEELELMLRGSHAMMTSRYPPANGYANSSVVLVEGQGSFLFEGGPWGRVTPGLPHLRDTPDAGSLWGYGIPEGQEQEGLFRGEVAVMQVLLRINNQGRFWFTGTTPQGEIHTSHIRLSHLFDGVV